MQNRKSKLLQLVSEKLAEPKSAKQTQSSRTAPTRAQNNRANSTHSTGPKSQSGKAKASANSLKHGFFANVAKLHPHDSPAYQDTYSDLRLGLQPDGPVEELLIRELAMFRARLTRLEAAEYALVCCDIESDPDDAREVAAAFINNTTTLEQLHKAEVHLRRAYNRTWDRLERMQKERHKLPVDESLKRSQIWLTNEALRKNRPQDIPARHPRLNEKGKFTKYPKDHPMYRPTDLDDQEDNSFTDIDD